MAARPIESPWPGETPSDESGPEAADVVLHELARAFLERAAPPRSSGDDTGPSSSPTPAPAPSLSAAEHARRGAEFRYRTLVEQIPAVTFLASLEDGTPELYVSPQIEDLLGYTQQEWLNDPFLWFRQLHPDDRARWHEAFARTCATGVQFRSEYRFFARDGRVVWVLGECQVVRDDDGRPLFLQGIAFDITERKRAEAVTREIRDELERQVRERTTDLLRANELLEREVAERRRVEEAMRDSRARLQAILDTAVDAVVVIDAQGIIRQCNPAVERLLGFTSEELVGQNVCRLMPSPFRDEHGQYLNNYLTTGVRHVIGIGREVTARRKDGSLIAADLTVGEMEIMGERLFVGFMHDLSKRKRLEEELRQAHKMEAVGRLAGGIAHDFNNLLTIINGYSEVLVHRLRPDDPGHEMVRQVRKAGERAAALTQQLLAFSRRQPLAPIILDLNALIADMAVMLRRVIGEDVELITELNPDLCRTKADRVQLEQVLLNLAVNARDAMPGGGRLTLRTHSADLDAHRLRDGSVMPAGRYAVLDVEDTGTGMDEPTQALIFEPFFTTKEVGKGTGLGLAMAYGVVRQCGGFIDVRSAPGQGTRFAIHLPQATGEAQQKRPAAQLEVPPPGTETILLVEDEDGVREIAGSSLEALGYTVLRARNGEEALALAGNYAGTIHLLVTDVIMPKMSGAALAARLSILRPDLQILYVSGYPGTALATHGVSDSGPQFLPKPFTPTALAHRVRDLLDGARRS
jgi:PAS domain S-box-containing protein